MKIAEQARKATEQALGDGSQKTKLERALLIISEKVKENADRGLSVLELKWHYKTNPFETMFPGIERFCNNETYRVWEGTDEQIRDKYVMTTFGVKVQKALEQEGFDVTITPFMMKVEW